MLNWNSEKTRSGTSPVVRQKDRIYEQLEERVLFDAVPDGSLDQLADVTDDPYAPVVGSSGDGFAINAATAAEQSPETLRREIVFVDKSVDDYEQLVAELVVGKNTEVYFLEQDADGLQQITDVLAERSGIDAVHIISHGNDAELHLGSTILTAESMRGAYSDELAIVRNALTDTADLLIYGCNFGAGDAGRDAANALADATGADVAASDDDTGNAERGGDWDLEVLTGAIESRVLAAANWNGLLAPTLRLDLGNVQPTEVDLTGTGDGSVGLQATWVNAGFVGAQRIDLRATIISQDTSLTHDLYTRSFAGSYFPSISSVGQDWVEIQWEIFATGTTDAVTADIIVGLNDLDGPNNEAIRFNVCDPVIEHLLLSSNTQMGHAFDSGTGNVTLDGQANYAGVDERISVQVAYYDQTEFTISRTANSGFVLSFDFNETLTYTDPLEFDCTNFELPVSADDSVIALGGAPVSVAILENDSSSNSGAANTVELVVPAGATNIVTDNDFDEVGFDIAGEGTWHFDEFTSLLTFTPQVGFMGDPTPIQYTFENIDGIGSNTSTVTIDLQYSGPAIDLDASTTGSGYLTTFTEGTSPVAIVNSDVFVTDADSTAMESITITPSGVVNGANEVLTFNGDGATSISFGMDGIAATTQQITVNGVVLDVAYNGTDFTVTRSGGGTIDNNDVTALLTTATYENATSAAIPGNRTLNISVSDGVFASNVAASVITVIPDYLSVAASAITINEDQSTTLGVTVDPDLYLGGPLQDVIGTAAGFRTSTAGAASTDFTIPENVTGIVITGYSTEPDDTGADDTFNDDYQVLSAYIDVAKGISNGTLTRHIDLSSGVTRNADQFSWLGAELGTAVLDGGATLTGETASGTNPMFTIVGNTLQVVENHGLQTSYHVEFMTSNRESTTFVGALSGAQLPGETSTTLSIPTGTNYLILNENAAAPGANFRFEYKGFSRIYIDLDTMTASGTIAAEIGENADRTVSYAFENYDISSSTPGGILASTATIVGDVTAQAAVANSPNIYIDGAGDLVIERTSGFATDFTSMYTLEAYDRTGYSSIAAIVDANADDAFFNATLGGGVVNTLTFEVPSSATIGVFRLSMGTPGGNGDNENMGTGFAIIDLENGTSSGSFMNIRTTTPDLLSWSGVALTDNVATAGTDERVFFTDPGTVSNRNTLPEFTDGWGGTAYFDLVTNPDGTRTITFNAISDVGDNAYEDYQTHGQFTWLGNEPFRIRTTGAGGTFSHGSPVLDAGGNPTGVWEIDVLDLPSVTYTPDPHYSGTGYLEVELLSTGEYERIDINVLPIADTPTLTLTDPGDVNKGQTSDLSSAIATALVDTDGSESISLIELSSISDGFTVGDGTNTFTAGGGTSSVDITSWNLAALTLDSPADYAGTESINVRVQTTDNKTINGTPYSDTTLPSDTNPGETEATGALNATWINVVTALDLDGSDNTAAGADYAATFVEGGAAVAIADTDTTLSDSDDATLASVTITPGVGEFPDGANEILTFNGDGATSISFAIDEVAAATQQITINGAVLDVAYDGTAMTITRNGPGEILQADVVALLESTTYANTDPTPTTTDRTFAIKTNDGNDDSNVAAATIAINTADASAAWSISGPASVDEGDTANFSVALTGNLLQAGEVATVVLTLTDTTTTPADYANFLTTVSTVVASRSDLSFDTLTGTLTYTSAGGSMTALVIPLTITNDATIEGPESFGIDLSGAGSTTGETISLDGAASSVTTTINDTQGVGGAADGPGEWSLTGATSVDEGGSAGYTLSLAGTYGANETATVQIDLSDISTNSSDYAAILTALSAAAAANPDVTFDGTDTFTYTAPSDGAAMTDLAINLGITDDALIEGAESFSLTISNPGSTTGGNVGLMTGATTVATIVDDTQGDGGAVEGPADWSISGPAAVNEGSPATYTLSLSGSFGDSENASITLGLTDNTTAPNDHGVLLSAVQAAITAGSRTDLALVGSVLTFTSASEGAAMSDLGFNLTTTQDSTVESNEDFDITLTSPSSTSGISVTTSTASINTVINDDADVAEVSIAPSTQGNEAGPVNGSFTVSLSNPSATDTVIDYSVGGTANGSDHTLTNGTVTISAGMTTSTITVPVIDDSLIEGIESVSVTLDTINSGDAQISVGASNAAAINIVDDELAGEWALAGTSTIDEGGAANYTLSLSGTYGANETATVQIDLSDISTNSSDYAGILTALSAAAAANPDVTFDGTDTFTYTAPSDGAAMTDLAINLGITDDALIEGAESFSLAISNPGSTSGATIGLASGGSSVLTVVNDTQGVGGAVDGPATWSVSGTTAIDEGGMANFAISLSGMMQNGENASVDLTLGNINTDTADYADFLAAVDAAVLSRSDLAFNSTTGTLTYIGDGNVMADLAISLAITDDSAVEGDEQFFLALANAVSTSGAATAVDSLGGSVTTTIHDTQGVGGGPDQADWSIGGDSDVDEGGVANFTISLDALLQAGETSTVDLTFIDIETDSADYGDYLAAIQSAVSSRSDLSFDNGTGQLTFTSTGSLMSDLAVNLIAIDDTLAEGPERYQILLSNPGSSSGATIGIDPSGNNLTTTIGDTVGDGGALEEVVWSFGADQTVAEGSSGAYLLSLSGTLAAGESVSIDMLLSDIETTAADHIDLSTAISNAVVTYNASPAPGSLTWNGTALTFTSDGSGPMTDLLISLGTVNDGLSEGVEDFRVSLANATSTTGVSVSIDATSDDSITTIDDTVGPGADEATWSVGGATVVDEGGTVQYTIRLIGTLQAAETAFVDLALGDLTTNSTDYSSFVTAVQNAIAARSDLAFDAGTGVLTYTADGNPMADLLVDISITDDSLLEGPEQFDLMLSAAGSGTGALIGIDPMANNVTTTINDTVGDGGATEPGGEWSITGSSNVSEGGTAAYALAVTGNLQVGEDASVQLSFTDLETTAADYAAFTAAMQNAVTAYSGPGGVSFDAGTGILTFVSDGSGPMASLNVNLVANDDALIEGGERFRIDLGNAQSSTGLTSTISSSNGSLTTTINDDETAIWSVTGTGSVDEGGIATFTFALAGIPQAGEQISAVVNLSDIETNIGDYASLATALQAAAATRPDLAFDAGSGVLTFTGTGSAMADLVVNLQMNDDSLTEGPEMFSVGLSSPASATGSSVQLDAINDQALVTINDTLGDGGPSETSNWSVTAPSVVDEGGTLAFQVTLSGVLQSGEDASVDLGFVDVGTNPADRDDFETQVQAAVAAYSGPGSLTYDVATSTLTFLSDGSAMGPLSIDLPITDDAILEGPEDLSLTLSAASSSTGAAIAIDGRNASITTTIDDTQGVGGAADGPANWSLAGTSTIDEGGTINYTLGLSEVLQFGETAGVTIALTDVSTDSSDYGDLMSAIQAAAATRPDIAFNPTTGELTFTGTGGGLVDLAFSLNVTDDSAVEGDEVLSVALSNPVSGSGVAVGLASGASSVLTTVNDTQGVGGAADSADWSIVGDAMVDEGGTASFTISLDALLQAGESSSVEIILADIETSAADYGDLTAAIQAAVSSRGDLSFDSGSGSLTFLSSGSLMTDLMVNLVAVDDALAEGPERYQILLSNPGSSTGAAISIDPSTNSLTTTIRDTVGDAGPLEGVIWSVGHDLSVAEGNNGTYILSLDGPLAAGESASVDIVLSDIDTTPADYDDFNTAMIAAVAGYNAGSTPGSLAWDGTTMTFSSDGAGPMADVVIVQGTVNDVLSEGPEDVRISLTNPNSATGVQVSLDATADDGVTTIDDTIGPNSDEATWSASGTSSIDEGGTLQYTLSLAGILQAGETAHVQLNLDNITTSTGDYASFPTAVQNAIVSRPDLTFDVGTGLLTYTGDGSPMVDLAIDLLITDDALLEGPEQFALTLTNAGSGSGALIGIDALGDNVTTTINDTAGLGGAAEAGGQWSITGSSNIAEGATAGYAVAVSGLLQAGEIATVQLTLADIESDSADHAVFTTAVQNAIASYVGAGTVTFDAATGVLSFVGDGLAPMSALNIDLATNGDSLIEGPERFRIDLGNPQSTSGLSTTVSSTAGSRTTNIIDDETATWSVAGTPNVDEGGNAQFTFALSGVAQAGEEISVVLNLANLDTNNADYASLSDALTAAVAARPDLTYDAATGRLTFTSSGGPMADLVVDLPITDDSLTEGPESFEVQLDLPASGTGSAVQIDAVNDAATVEIADTLGNGGAAETASWSVTAPTTIDEGGTQIFTIRLSGILQSSEDARVNLGFADLQTNLADHADFAAGVQTAVAGYSGPGSLGYDPVSSTLTFVSDGSAMGDLAVALPITNDTLLEGPEDFRLTLSGPNSSTGSPIGVDATNAAVTTTVNDTQGVGGTADGPAEWALVGDASTDEGGSIRYTLSLSETLQAGESAHVQLTLNDLTTDAADHDDFVAALALAMVSRPDLSFDAATGVLTYTSIGGAMPDLTFDLGVTDDSLVEGPETLQVTLSNAASSTGVASQIAAGSESVITTINDTQGVGGRADTADWSILGDTSVDEGGIATFTIRLDALLQIGEAVSVDLSLNDLETTSADYAGFVTAIQTAVASRADLAFDAATGQLTYAADGAPMADLVFGFATNDDTLAEGPERFQVVLANSQSSTGAAVALDPARSSVSTTINDTLGSGGPNEQPVWSLSGPASGNEGATSQFTVSLSQTLQIGETATIDLSLGDLDTDTADYDNFVTAVQTAIAARPELAFDTGTGTLTLTSLGSPMADLVIDLGLIDDILVEGPEDYRLSLSNPGSTTGVDVTLDAALDDAVSTIVDSDSVAGTDDATWAVAGSSVVDEGVAATLTFSLGGTLQAGETAFVDLTLTDLETTAADYGDFTNSVQAAVASRTDLAFDVATGRLTFTGDGNPMADLIVNLATVDDALVEGAERFEVVLSNAGSGTGAAIGIGPNANQLTTTINDTQGAGGATEFVAWTIGGTTSVDEGGLAGVTIGLDGILQAGEVAAVRLTFADLTTDGSDRTDLLASVSAAVASRPDLMFDAATGILSFTGTGAAMSDLAVTLAAIDDTTVEGPEQFNIRLGDPASGTGARVTVDATQDDLTTTINDTMGDGGVLETGLWSLTAPANVDEGATAALTLALSGTLQAGDTAYVRLALSDLDTNSADYADLATSIQAAVASRPDLTFDALTGTVTFTSSGGPMTPLNISLLAIDDILSEGPEAFTVAIANAGSSTGANILLDATADSADVTINDTQGAGGPVEAAAWNISGSNTVDEGGIASYTVQLEGLLQAGEVASVRLNLGDLTTTAADHDALARAIQTALTGRGDLSFDGVTGVLTYSGDGTPMTELTFSLAAAVDQQVEGPELFTLVASNPFSATGAPITVGSGSIVTTIVDVEPATNLNSAPIASDDTATVFENSTVSGDLLNNDSDPDGDTISIDTTPVANVANGSLTINPDGTFTYSPNTGFTGTDTFTYQITDADGNAATATVSISVTPDYNGGTNNLPVANADSVTTQKNIPLTGSLLDNDTDPNGNILTVISGDGNPVASGVPATFSTAGGGSVTLRADGTFDYSPADDFTGTDQFRYTISDGAGGTSSAFASLSVFDGAPVANDDINVTSMDKPATGNVLTNDHSGLDQNDTLTVSTTPVTPASNGTLVLNSDGTYIYTPDSGFTGSDAFEYEVCDENGNCATALVTFEVRDAADPAAPGNTSPVASNDLVTALTNLSTTTSVTGNDADPDGDLVTVTAISGIPVPAGSTATLTTSNSGTVLMNADGTLTYTSATGFIGEDTFVYTLSDATGNIDTATVTINVAPDRNGTTNNAPVAGDDLVLARKNTPVTGNLLINDSDINGDPLTVNATPLNGPANGTLVLNADGSFTYTPADDYVGNDSFVYEVCDTSGACGQATVLLSVFDGVPVAVGDIAVTSVDTSVSGNVLTNDVDPNPGDDLAVTAIDGQPLDPAGNPTAGGGTIVMNPDGSYTYTPAAGFVGNDTFSYTIADEGGNADTATISIEVRDTSTPPNSAPVANDDSPTTFQDTPVAGSLLSNDSDPDGDPLTINTTPLTAPANGTLVLNPDGTFTYTPDTGFVGSDSFVYQVCDDSGVCSAATVTVSVLADPTPGANDAPFANDDTVSGTENATITGNLLANDSDPNGDPLTINTTPVTGPANGTLVINNDGTFFFTPDTGFVGTDTFRYEVCDDLGDCSTATVTVQVAADPPPNAPAVVNDESFTLFENAVVTGSLTANDGDPEGGAVTINTTPLAGPTNGSITINPDGTFIYTPSAGFTGTDTVQYEVCDAEGNCDTGVVTFNVQVDSNGAANDAPTASDDAAISTLNEVATGFVLANDSDPNGDALTVQSAPVVGPTNGTLVLNTDGSFVYTPNNDFAGNDSFVYTVEDGNGGTATATVRLTVFAQRPTANPDRITTTVGAAVSGNVLTNDTDPDTNDTLIVNTTPFVGPTNGTLVLNIDGTFTYTPDAGFTGVDTFEYEVRDDAGVCDTGLVTVAIADISSALQVVDVVPNEENFDVTLTVTIHNTGGTELTDLALVEDVASQFGGSFVAVTDPILDASGINSGVVPTVNPAWTGDSTQNLLNPAGPQAVLQPNESFVLTFIVTVDPDAGGTSGPVWAQTGVTATDHTTLDPRVTSDLSDAGSDPRGTNPNAPGDSGSRDDATPILIADSGLVSEVSDIERDGINLILTMDFVLENTGTADLGELVLIDDLRDQLGDGFDMIVGSPLIIASTATSDPTLNGAWGSDTSQNMLDGTSGLLKPGESITIQIRVKTQPGSSGATELIFSGLGGGQGRHPDGTPLLNPDGSAAGISLDVSDSGDDPNGTNPGAPGDTGGTADPTSTSVQYYAYDTFNEFSTGHGNQPLVGPIPLVERELLSRTINTLAPEPIFSGSARPGTRIVGRIYNSAGHVVGESMSFADTGGNWMVQFHNVRSLDFHRIEFVELVGQSDQFGAHGDIYGYLGTDVHNNDYAAMEPATAFAEWYSLGSVYRGSATESLEAAHQQNVKPLGFGV